MEPEVPAQGILKMDDCDNSVVYQVTCHCMDPDHAHVIFIEQNPYEEITVSTYIIHETNFWRQSRWRTMWTLLTKGYVRYEATLIMTKQQALTYATALKSSLDKFKGK